MRFKAYYNIYRYTDRNRPTTTASDSLNNSRPTSLKNSQQKSAEILGRFIFCVWKVEKVGELVGSWKVGKVEKVDYSSKLSELVSEVEPDDKSRCLMSSMLYSGSLLVFGVSTISCLSW